MIFQKLPKDWKTFVHILLKLHDINKHVTTNVGELLNKAIRFADTKRDPDLI